MKTSFLDWKRFATLLAALVIPAIPVPASAQWTNGQKANGVIGQPNFTLRSSGASASALALPKGVAIDPTTGKIFVADSDNHRVLRFASAAAMAKGAAAEAVFGQPNFTTNQFGTAADKFNAPIGIDVDDAGRLWVADSGNHRVLRFDDASSLANQPAADGVLGQLNFTTRTRATTRQGLRGPRDVEADAQGRLWIADTGNNRVLRHDFAALKANGAPASGVLGQANFTSRISGTASNRMDDPIAVVSRRYTTDGGATYRIELWVAERWNHRVLRFDHAAAKPPGGHADGVLGQPDFTSDDGVTSRSGMSIPEGIELSGRDLFVSDGARVLVFEEAPAKADGSPADAVLGQPDFVSFTRRTTQSGLNDPLGLAADANGNLLVADRSSHRIIRFSPGNPQPDNQIGIRPTRQKGDNIYNGSSAGQKLAARSKGRGGKLHFTVQNDGPFDDRFRARSTRGNRKITVKYFQVTGGRRNITARITRGTGFSPEVEYRSSLRLLAKFQTRGKARKTLSLVTTSLENNAVDRVSARVIAR